MLRLFSNGSRLCDGVNRREWLRLGGLSLGGLTLPGLLRSRVHANESAGTGTAKSVIVLFISGGFPQHEGWDPKPEAPKEVRGVYDAISTRTPGLLVGELMPRTALLTDRIAVIRSMVTGDNAHSTSGYQMLTGQPHIPLNRENAGPGKPNDWPSMNAVVQSLQSSRGGLPASISLPRRLANNNGQDPWPGTDGGFLGQRSDPWFLDCDPTDKNFTVPGGEFLEGMAQARLDSRLSLLDQLRNPLDSMEEQARLASYNSFQQQALDLIAGGKTRQAFDIQSETPETRERYSNTKFGQSVLLARRLVEAGTSLVQVQAISDDKKRPNGGGWDTHEKHNESLKGWLMPTFDQAYSALLTDLDERGMLDETLVCLVTEFGHTPKFNARLGRDHWGRVFSIALAGGGIRGGVVHGASDKHAAEPETDPVKPEDYLATVYHCLGYSNETFVPDLQGRPIPITRGKPIESLLS